MKLNTALLLLLAPPALSDRVDDYIDQLSLEEKIKVRTFWSPGHVPGCPPQTYRS
jgi:hypothetical protein